MLPGADNTPQTYKGPEETLHVYLLIGQSNMAGRAPYTEEETEDIQRCYLLNGEDQWEPAKNPLNRYSSIRKDLGMQKLNPGYSFSKTILEENKDISIGLVVNARGGSSIEEWSKGSRFYKEAIRRTEAALEAGVLKGVLWHQGESDAGDPHYLEKLQLLIQNLRSDFGDSNLPFVAGQVNDAPLINHQIANLPETVDSTGFASSEGLEVMDRWHFNARSMKLLGQRYAKEILKIHTKQEAEQDTFRIGSESRR
ncbi:MAG: sialate O-acetylesterase [Candidatus Hydrogenedentota bacterium]